MSNLGDKVNRFQRQDLGFGTSKQGLTGRVFQLRVGFGYWKKLLGRVRFGFGFGYWYHILNQSGIIGY